MSNKQIKILKIIACINIAAIIILSSFIFYGEKYEIYDEVSIDGTCSKHGFIDLIRLSYFENEKMRTSASLNVLKNIKTTQSNYMCHAFLNTNDDRLTLSLQVSEDCAAGNIKISDSYKDENGDKQYASYSYPIYIESKNNKTVYYIKYNDVWNYFEADASEFAVNTNAIVEILKTSKYKQLPRVIDSTEISEIFPSDSRMSVSFCCNEHIRSVRYKEISENDFNGICPQPNVLLSQCIKHVFVGSTTFDLTYEFDAQGLAVDISKPDLSKTARINDVDQFVQTILRGAFADE